MLFEVKIKTNYHQLKETRVHKGTDKKKTDFIVFFPKNNLM